MKILLLGGGWFLGPAIAEAALAAGHQVTAFHRRPSRHDVAGTRVVCGDRRRLADLDMLAAIGPWDAVVDTSGGTPEQVMLSARILSPRAGQYIYVSTVNAYRGWPNEPLTENSPLYPAGDLTVDADAAGTGSAEQYGRAKVGCEAAAQREFAGHVTVLRPAVILGPREYVGRLPWWIQRFARIAEHPTRQPSSGRVLAPGKPGRTIQPIDVRDVAAFTVHCAEHRLAGPYNLAAPIGGATFRELLGACRGDIPAELAWVDDDFLLSHGVQPWTELPLWRPNPGTWQVDASRARAGGLHTRPLLETVADTKTWMAAGGRPVYSPRAGEHGITPAKESQLLTAWTGQHAA